MGGLDVEEGKDFFGGLLGHFQVKRIGTEVQVFGPPDRAGLGDSGLFEKSAFQPGGENTLANHRGEIDFAFLAIVKAQVEAIPIERFESGDFLHGSVSLNRRMASSGRVG